MLPSQDLETFEKKSVQFYILLFYVLTFFKKGDTIQGGGTLFKEIRYLKVQYFVFQIDYHVLLMPVKGSSNGGFYGIMEFLRNEDDSPFYDEDEEIVNSYMGGLWKIKLTVQNYRIFFNIVRTH